jgi:hypothetical protein
MALFPLYYFPKGMKIPGHLREQGRPVLQVPRDVGPIGCAENENGGKFWGADETTPLLATPLFKRTRFGWFIAMGNAGPENMHRFEGVTKGHIINGLQPGHRWHIPCLLKKENGVGFTSVVEPVYVDGEWRVPVKYRLLTQQLVSLFEQVDGYLETTREQKLELVEKILALNYHISIAELEFSEWLTPVLCWKIIVSTLEHAGAQIEEEDEKTFTAKG